MEDLRLGKEIVSKDNLSATGKIFAEIVCGAYNNRWKKYYATQNCKTGFGSARIAYYETRFNARKNKDRHEALMWLVKNGYLCCYTNGSAKAWKEKYSCYYDVCNAYFVTQKGWSVAHLYVQEAERP